MNLTKVFFVILVFLASFSRTYGRDVLGERMLEMFGQSCSKTLSVRNCKCSLKTFPNTIQGTEVYILLTLIVDVYEQYPDISPQELRRILVDHYGLERSHVNDLESELYAQIILYRREVEAYRDEHCLRELAEKIIY